MNSIPALVGHWEDLVNYIHSFPEWKELENGLGDLSQPMSWNEFYRHADHVWEQVVGDTGIDSPDFEERLGCFYSHPIWLLNGLLVDCDPLAVEHRLTAVRAALGYQPQKVMDVGGGYGTLVRLMGETCPFVQRIELLEPYGAYAHPDLAHLKNVIVVKQASPPYDVLFSTEVLEHLQDPFREILRLNQWLRRGGGLVATWSFMPGMHCHLSYHHYLQPIFHYILRMGGFGLRAYERVPSPVWSFQKVRDIDPHHWSRVSRFFRRTRFIWTLWKNSLHAVSLGKTHATQWLRHPQ